MNFLNLEVNLADEPGFGRADARQRGAWLSLMFHCIAIENGGVMIGAGQWSEREWLKTCSLSFEDLDCDEAGNPLRVSPLWHWIGHDLHLLFYPHHHAARMEAMREGGKKGGRPRKYAEPENPPLNLPLNLPLNPPLNPPLNRNGMEEKVKEGKGTEERSPDKPGDLVLSAESSMPTAQPEADAVSSKSMVDPAPAPKPRKKEGGGGVAGAEPEFPADLAAGYQKPLTEWWHYKRERREGYKSRGWAALVEREREHPVWLVEASVKRSMANGWSGLFTDKHLQDTGGQKKGGGAGVPAGPSDTLFVGGRAAAEAPEGWERAMLDLFGEGWQSHYGAYETLLPADQRQVRAWLEREKKKRGGGHECPTPCDWREVWAECFGLLPCPETWAGVTDEGRKAIVERIEHKKKVKGAAHE